MSLILCLSKKIKLKIKVIAMKKNMGLVDKIMRFIVAIGLSLLYYFDIITGTVALVFLIFSIFLVITSFVSFCPMYVPLNVSTRKKEK